MIVIDDEFKNLIPALSSEEYEQLEENCVAEGIRDALVVWRPTPEGDILIDGHNRYSIATKHHLPYKIVGKSFADRNAVKLWMIDNQLSRRNIDVVSRIELAQVKAEIIKEMAEEHLHLAKGQGVKVCPNGQRLNTEPIHTRQEVAKIANVDTLAKF